MSEAPAAFDGRAFARRIGTGPGVYLMRGADNTALYVGKARNLRKRVASYFDQRDKGPRIARMVSRIRAIEVSLTRTEGEALLLENEWIKSLKPRYNVQLRDDKSYPYIHVTTRQDFPRIAFHRGARAKSGEYFGPYPSAGAVRASISLIQKLFRLRNCEDSFFEHRSRPCLQYQIERCTAPCVGFISEDDYQADVQHALWFLRGRSQEVIRELIRRMEAASEALNFERAALLRDQIQTLKQMQAQQFVAGRNKDIDVLAAVRMNHMVAVQVVSFRGGRNLGQRSHFPINTDDLALEAVMGAFVGQYYQRRQPPPEILLSHAPDDLDTLTKALGEQAGRRIRLQPNPRGERRRWVQMAEENALNALKLKLASRASLVRQYEALEALLKLDQPVERVECFDISHLSGQQTVGSCVVFDREGPNKSQYRRFNLKGITPGDDYAAMAQVLKRRYERMQKESRAFPDLIIVDGGRGQLNAARAVLRELGVDDDQLLMGVAKGPARRAGHEQWLVDGAPRALQPGPDSPASHLVQQIRDEAHRFAITGHRGRRQKRAQTSTLETVPGIGSKRRRALLTHFGGLKGVEKAGVEELASVPGISRQLAETIYAHLHGV